MEVDDKEYKQMQSDLKAATEAASGLAGMQESITKLEANNKDLLKEKSDAKKATQAAELEAAKKSGDFETLEASWQDKLKAETESRDKKLSVYESAISKITSGAAAKTMAADLALPGKAEGLMPHIESRLSTEITESGPITRILDKDGKPTAMSLDDLRKEIEETDFLKPLLVGSLASGSGDVGKKGGKTTDKTATRDAFDAMSQSERSAFAIGGGKVVDVH